MFCSNWLMFYYSQQRFLEQHSIVATLLQVVSTLFQHCNAVLRWKSLLRIVSCNIILKRPRRGRDNRELKQRRRRRQRERQQSTWFRLAKKQLCTCITLFLHISLPSLQDYNVKVPNFTFWRGRENKTTTFLLLFLNFAVFQNLTPEQFANIWRIKRVGISAIMFEVARIHFLSDVFVAFAVVVAEAP